jgi:hypothetical protein
MRRLDWDEIVVAVAVVLALAYLCFFVTMLTLGSAGLL